MAMVTLASRRVVRSQAGFTIIEVLVSALLISIGLATTAGMLDSASHATNVAERHQSALEIAQRALEQTDDLDFDQLALTSTPVNSADPNDPRNRVSGSQFLTETGSYEPMAIGGDDAAVEPGPETIDEGGQSAQVYRFVTWVDAPTYQGCTLACSGTQDYKRITIAVKVPGTFKGFEKYVLVSTLRIDSLLGPEGEVTQPEDPNPTQAHDNFYLYDTRNQSCTTNAYQQPSGDHAVHDTRGYCGSPGADYSDLMWIDQPPNPYDPDLPPVYTFSNDLEGQYSGGIAIQRNTDCTLTGLTKYQLHAWETNAVSNLTYELTGKLSFDFWTAAVGGASGSAKICVWLYDRVMVGGSPQDALIASSSYSLGNWPGELTNLSFTSSHETYTLPPNHRLRLVLTVSSQSATDVQLRYDHPAAPSFIQVRTTTPITE